MMSELALRRQIVATARRMNDVGLNRGTSGNVSARSGRGFLVTPSGLPCEDMRPADIVAMSSKGVARGKLAPSTEWRFHRDIYVARPDVGAIVHAHSMFATTMACLRRGIPPFNYMVAVAGGSDIRCAAYATFGTQALSDRALAALEGRNACLLANHGMIALGKSLDAAFALAVEVEALAEQYWRVLQIETPKLLSAAEMDTVLEKFRSYGKRERR